MEKLLKDLFGYKIVKAILPKDFTLNRKHTHFQQLHRNLCECLVDDPVVKMPDFDGIFAIDVRSDLFKRILFYKEYESHLAKCCLSHLDKEGDVVDVGTNVGFFSVLLAKNTNGKVLSIEPSKNVLNRLYRNIKMNKVDNIYVYEGVVSDKCDTIDINIIDGKEEYSSVGKIVHSSVVNMQASSTKVNSSTLDKLVEEYKVRPKLIKVDAEGVEHLVFSGAKKVLNEFKPIIFSEIVDYLLKNNGSSSVEVIKKIKSYGYQVFDVQNPNKEIDRISNGNILCKPKIN